MDGQSYSQNAAAALRAEIKRIRSQIVDIVVEIDHVRLQEIPNIQAEYAVRIGGWEANLMQAELACRRAKRKLTLAQAKVNDGLVPDDVALEEQLDEELSEWNERVVRAVEAQLKSLVLISGSRALTTAEVARMKRIYRVLVKRLHPDLHAGKEYEQLFSVAKRAYEDGALDMLQSLELSTRYLETGDADLDAMNEDELAVELELAKIELGVMQEKLEEIMKDPVFEQGRLLRSPQWVTATISGLKERAAEFDSSRETYERAYQELVKGVR